MEVFELAEFYAYSFFNLLILHETVDASYITVSSLKKMHHEKDQQHYVCNLLFSIHYALSVNLFSTAESNYEVK